MRPVTRCSGVTGVACRKPTPRIVAYISPWWGGQAAIGVLELRLSGARQQPARVKQGAQQHNQDHRRERGDTMTMRQAAPKHTNVAPRRPLKRSSEIIIAAIIYLTASCFAVVGTLGFVAAIWALWGTLGVR